MFFFIFLIVELYFLIAAVNKQIFNPLAELVIPTGISTKEEKEEMERHQVTGEIKIS